MINLIKGSLLRNDSYRNEEAPRFPQFRTRILSKEGSGVIISLLPMEILQ